MKWIFGKYKQKQELTSVNDESISENDSGVFIEPGRTDKGKKQACRFDSTALERAAEAAILLERSKHVRDALELSRLQEKTRQDEYQCKLKEYEMHIEQAKIELKRTENEERRKTLIEETKQQAQRLKYQDHLTRKRYEDQLLLQQKTQDEYLRKQEESVARQETLRLKTIEQELQMKEKNRMKLLEHEMRTRAKLDREYRDIYLEQISLKAQEHRLTALDSVRNAGSVIGNSVEGILTDWRKIFTAASGLSLLALGIYSARGATSIATRYIEARIGKPALVGETTRYAFMEALKHPLTYMKNLQKRSADVFQGIILEPKLEQRLRDIAIATKNTRVNRGLYRNVLMHGPPGTGKTLFAKKLAEHSGMDYAIMTGGDVAPMGKHGVSAIHDVFNWSQTSRRGLLLFVDEADEFLRKRSSEHISEDLRASLNAFLYRTSEQNSKIMLVLASNTPEQFDFAINDRVDEMVEFILPGLEERDRLLRFYFDKYILRPAERIKRFKVEKFDYNALCSKMAKICQGMSGREISKLGVAWQSAVYASKSGILTEQMVLDKCIHAVDQHRQKITWLSDQERNDQKTIAADKISSKLQNLLQ